MTEIIEILREFGFPVFVTCFLLIYFRKSVDNMKDVVAANTAAILKLVEHLNGKDC